MYPTEHTSLSGVALVLITNVACSRNALLTILLCQVLPLPQPRFASSPWRSPAAAVNGVPKVLMAAPHKSEMDGWDAPSLPSPPLSRLLFPGFTLEPITRR